MDLRATSSVASTEERHAIWLLLPWARRCPSQTWSKHIYIRIIYYIINQEIGLWWGSFFFTYGDIHRLYWLVANELHSEANCAVLAAPPEGTAGPTESRDPCHLVLPPIPHWTLVIGIALHMNWAIWIAPHGLESDLTVRHSPLETPHHFNIDECGLVKIRVNFMSTSDRENPGDSRKSHNDDDIHTSGTYRRCQWAAYGSSRTHELSQGKAHGPWFLLELQSWSCLWLDVEEELTVVF